MDVTTLDGRTFAKFVAAGTYFLRKYRGVLNDLNVYPVPDGDTGSNLYLTARAAWSEATRQRAEPLSVVAEAVARGSLLGARGNSGVILSQMLRGFAHAVRELPEADATTLAAAMLAGAATGRAALHKPVEGTMISVADAAAGAAALSAASVSDLRRLADEVVRAAADALAKTPEQLPMLGEAGVVDSGGAGIVYFLEGLLRFLPEGGARETSFPHAANRVETFSRVAPVAANRYCTEFLIEDVATSEGVRELLETHGDSLIVAGAPPTLKIHLHTANPDAVRDVVMTFGRPVREKVEDMDLQHRLLLVDAPPRARSVVAVSPGPGFTQIFRDAGADSVVDAHAGNPSVRDLVRAVNATLGACVYLLPNDRNVALAAREAARLADRPTVVIPTDDPGQGLSVTLALTASEGEPDAASLAALAAQTRSASVFLAGRDSTLGDAPLESGQPCVSVAGTLLAAETVSDAVVRATTALGAASGDLVTLYYGGGQRDDDVATVLDAVQAAHPGVEIEAYPGGQRTSEFLVTCER